MTLCPRSKRDWCGRLQEPLTLPSSHMDYSYLVSANARWAFSDSREGCTTWSTSLWWNYREKSEHHTPKVDESVRFNWRLQGDRTSTKCSAFHYGLGLLSIQRLTWASFITNPQRMSHGKCPWCHIEENGLDATYLLWVVHIDRMNENRHIEAGFRSNSLELWSSWSSAWSLGMTGMF